MLGVIRVDSVTLGSDKIQFRNKIGIYFKIVDFAIFLWCGTIHNQTTLKTLKNV